MMTDLDLYKSMLERCGEENDRLLKELITHRVDVKKLTAENEELKDKILFLTKEVEKHKEIQFGFRERFNVAEAERNQLNNAREEIEKLKRSNDNLGLELFRLKHETNKENNEDDLDVDFTSELHNVTTALMLATSLPTFPSEFKCAVLSVAFGKSDFDWKIVDDN